MRLPFPLIPAMIGLLVAGLASCASPVRADYRATGHVAESRQAAVQAATRALARRYQNVRLERRGHVVTADPSFVDFGETELDMVGRTLEEPTELVQAFGRIRRTPSIRIEERDGDRFGFAISVLREVEELEAGYVPYGRAYDANEAASMPTDPSLSAGAKAPPKAVWVPQGNDAVYEAELERALGEELAR